MAYENTAKNCDTAASEATTSLHSLPGSTRILDNELRQGKTSRVCVVFQYPYPNYSFGRFVTIQFIHSNRKHGAEMHIDNENTFQVAIRQGVNMFLGAGFSVLAHDVEGRPLPTAGTLATELTEYFNMPNAGILSLPHICTIIESKQRARLRQYLTTRFSVGRFDSRYRILDQITIRSIFTTNIDDLLYKVFAESPRRYLNDLDFHGPSLDYKTSVELITLHGCIIDQSRPLRFTDVDLASAFANDPDRWNFLTNSLQRAPTLFWGYGLNDAGTLQSLSPDAVRGRGHHDKWIVLRPESDTATVDFFRALDFQIIFADTAGLLDYFSSLNLARNEQRSASAVQYSDTAKLFPAATIPAIGSVPVRPLIDFYLGAAPQWSDIFSGRIQHTNHQARIKNSINSGRHVLIIGVPACGKSTLLMQAAVDAIPSGHKLFFDTLTAEQAAFVCNRLGTERAIVFIDNFTDSVGAVECLIAHDNVQVVGADREHNFQAVSHRIDQSRYDVLDVTELTEHEIQRCLQGIPESIKRVEYRPVRIAAGVAPSLFEAIETNLREPTLRKRFAAVLEDLRNNDYTLLQMLLMFAYVHSCRTPVSMDMLIAFLRDVTREYQEVYSLRNQLGEMVSDYLGPLSDENQDYFVARSELLARAVLENARSAEIKAMLLKFHKQISPARICRFDVFRRRAYDADIAVLAFEDWREGLEFYEKMHARDRSAYLLQQGALYLSRRKRFQEAFSMIDSAVVSSGGHVWSIRNSHAIILFRANIDFVHDEQAQATLRMSMSILSDCHKSDKRKAYHATTYADLAMQYAAVIADDNALEYLQTAKKWLEDQQKEAPWSTAVGRLLHRVSRRLASLAR